MCDFQCRYLFLCNNGNIRTMCKIYSKLKIDEAESYERGLLIPSCPNPGRGEKINLNFYFHTSFLKIRFGKIYMKEFRGNQFVKVNMQNFQNSSLSYQDTYLGPCQICMMELLRNNQRPLEVSNFCKKLYHEYLIRS